MGELVDAFGGAGVVGEDDGRLRSRDVADQLGVGAGLLLVGCDDERPGVRDALPHLGQPLVGGAQHAGHPLAARVERGTPGLRDGVLRHRLAEPGGDLVARLGTPPHLAAVGEEDDGPHDMVGQRVPVPVGVVGGGPPDPVVAFLVRHEGNGVGVGTEGRTGEREPAGGGLEGLKTGLAPGLGVTGVVDLVEDDERLALLDTIAMQHGPHANPGIGHGDAVVLLAERPGAVLGIEFDPYPRRRLGPLLLQMLGGRDHGHLLHDMVVQQPGGERQRERRLAGAGSGDGEKVTRLLLEISLHRLLLPGTQLAGGAPGGTAGEGGREVMARGGSRGGTGGGGSHGLRGGGSGGSAAAVATATAGATYDNRATLPAARSCQRAYDAG